MNGKRSNSIDGFRPRKTTRVVSNTVQPVKTAGLGYYKPKAATRSLQPVLNRNRPDVRRNLQRQRLLQKRQLPPTSRRATVADLKVDQTLPSDFFTSQQQPIPKKNFFFFKPKDKNLSKAKSDSKGIKKPHRKTKFKLIIGSFNAICLLIVGVFIYNHASKILKAANNIIGGNIIDILKEDPLKQDANGRTNFLLFGTESDNLNSKHGGPLLTDSLMVVSYDHKTHKTSMISVPRDMWVKLERRCFVGDYAKINVVYQCGSDNGKSEKAGATALANKIGEITGLDIHYYAHINFQAVVKLVDAVGGVEVTIKSSDPRGIYDPNFDWRCNYKCNFVRYKNGPTGLMDGEHALALIRARNAQGGYGLPNSNFDREDNQRKVLTALVQKLAANGTVTNLGKVMKIIETLGDNLRTNIEAKELRSMVALAKKISAQFSSDSLNSISLANAVTTGNINGQSVVLPQGGIGDYSSIRTYIKKQISNQPFVKENPTVTVLNGSSTPGIAQKIADKLAEQGFTIKSVSNAPAKISNGRGYLYPRIGIDKPKSLDYLKTTLQMTIDTANQARYNKYNSDFVIVVGPGFKLD